MAQRGTRTRRSPPPHTHASLCLHADPPPPLPYPVLRENAIFKNFALLRRKVDYGKRETWHMKICCSFLASRIFSFMAFLFFLCCFFLLFDFFFFFWKLIRSINEWNIFSFFLRALFGECIAKHIHVVASFSSPPHFSLRFPALFFFAAQKLLVVVNVFELVHSVFR